MIVNAQASEDYDSMAEHFFKQMKEMTQRKFYHFSRSAVWNPAVNVYEDEAHFHICVELAGLTREQIHVEVAQQKITVRGERVVPVPPEMTSPECVLRMEINSGRFERSVELPDRADMESTEAKFKEGLLWIVVNKMPQ